jgi:EAL domain-containing protein (putative c-di-GMP-specific phosphodiesterase class I)
VAQARVRDVKPLRYVARQPIFDREEKVFGYELLFRDGLENAFHGDTDEASRATLDRTLLMGLDVLCDGRRAFVNCTRDTLIKGLVTLLPSTTTVVEILETVPGDPDVVAACQSLREAGYMIALDDYLADDPREGLTSLADIIKVDMQLTTEEQRIAMIQRLGGRHCRMLAEKIETHAEFVRARDQGFVYFQGYFFRRPEMMNTHDMPANQMNYLRMLQGSVASGIGDQSPGATGQGGSLSVLPAVAVFEFGNVRLPERDSFGAACAVDFGRAGCTAVGTSGGGRRRGAGENQRPCAVGTGAGAVWRVAIATSRARRVRLVLVGIVVADRCDAGNSDGGRAGENPA